MPSGKTTLHPFERLGKEYQARPWYLELFNLDDNNDDDDDDDDVARMGPQVADKKALTRHSPPFPLRQQQWR